MDVITGLVATLRRVGRQLGPYLMLELLLPGGSLLALALFLVRRWPPRLESVADLRGMLPRWQGRLTTRTTSRGFTTPAILTMSNGPDLASSSCCATVAWTPAPACWTSAAAAVCWAEAGVRR